MSLYDNASDTQGETFGDLLLAIIAATLVTIASVALIGVIAGIVVMMLWNWLVPEIFGLQQITYLQSWGMFTLVGTFFSASST